MKYFYDTEFHEDGKTIDFISIGIVAEDGRTFYAVSGEFDTRRVAQNEWLMENVMSSIDHDRFIVSDGLGMPLVRDLYITDPAARSRDDIARNIQAFIHDDPDPVFWAWYSAYDHVCLAQLYGRMIDLPENMPMVTHDIKTILREAEWKYNTKIQLPMQPEGLHNALSDAKHNKVRYDFLRENYG